MLFKQLYSLYLNKPTESATGNINLSSRFSNYILLKLAALYPMAEVFRSKRTCYGAEVSGYEVYLEQKLIAQVVVSTSTRLKDEHIFKSALYAHFGYFGVREDVDYVALHINKHYVSHMSPADYFVETKVNDDILPYVATFDEWEPVLIDDERVTMSGHNSLECLPQPFTKKLKNFITVYPNSSLKYVPDYLLNPTQQRVKSVTLAGTPYIDLNGFKAFFDEHVSPKSPSYFLDFESTQQVLPEFERLKPFEQLPFQYSLHCLTPSGSLNHYEFLELERDPRYLMATSLIEHVGDHGVIFVFNASFEKRIIVRLSELFAELKDKLLNIIKRIVDLHPVCKACFYHPSQQGSWSLKAVLPAILGYNPYAELDGVNNGGEASLIYHQVRNGEIAEQEAKKELLAYCGLDTYALYLLLDNFQQKLLAAA